MREPTTVTTLPGWAAAETVVRRFSAEGDVVWFDAGADADAVGASPREGFPRQSLVGWGSRSLTASLARAGSLDRAWASLGAASLGGASHDAGQGAEDAPLGWWGWLGSGAGAALLEPGDDSWAVSLGDPAHPDLAFLEVDRALVFDHDDGVVRLVVGGEVDDDARRQVADLVEAWPSLVAADAARTASTASTSTIATAPTAQRAPEVVPAGLGRRTARWRDTPAHYLDLIERCRAAIAAGQAYVLCLTTAVDVDGVDEPDLDVYARLRRSSPAPRASFVRLGGVSLLGASPEAFLTVDSDGWVSTSPIKGTRARGADPDDDSAAARELGADAKERAENLMIVDLLRNDLSRVCEPGSVEVVELFGVRSYEHVHQLVSTVRGRLRPGATGLDAVRSAFPPGSMTGAPKHRATRILGELESASRGPYAGAVGRLGFDGTVDLAVIIRSIVLDSSTGSARVGVGGGITASSVPEAELAEVTTKARPLLEVLGAPVGGSSAVDLDTGESVL